MNRTPEEQEKIFNKLSKNKLFQSKTLEVIYSLEKALAENNIPKYLLPDDIDENPSELNTVIFIMNSFKEMFEEEDENIFDKNKILFDFIANIRNVLWHKFVYRDHYEKLMNNRLFQTMININDWEYLQKILKDNKEKNKIEGLSMSFCRNKETELILVVINENAVRKINVIGDKLFLSLKMFKEAMQGLYYKVYTEKNY